MKLFKYFFNPKTTVHDINHFGTKTWSFEIKHKIDEKEIRSVLLSFEVNKQRL